MTKTKMAGHTQGVFERSHHQTGLHNKLLKPLAQGASRFEKLLARKKVTALKKITGLNFRNQRRGLHTKHDWGKKMCGPYGPVIIACHWPELARRLQIAGRPAGQCLLWRPDPQQHETRRQR